MNNAHRKQEHRERGREGERREWFLI